MPDPKVVKNGAVRKVNAYRSECAHCHWMSPLMAGAHTAADVLDIHVVAEHSDIADG